MQDASRASERKTRYSCRGTVSAYTMHTERPSHPKILSKSRHLDHARLASGRWHFILFYVSNVLHDGLLGAMVRGSQGTSKRRSHEQRIYLVILAQAGLVAGTTTSSKSDTQSAAAAAHED